MMFDSLLILNNPVFAYTAKCVKTDMRNFLLKVFFNFFSTPIIKTMLGDDYLLVIKVLETMFKKVISGLH